MANKASEAAVAHQVESSLLPSGLKITSLDSDSAAVSAVGVLVKSGSSYETFENQGASQAIRLNAGLATQNASSFSLVRNIQQMGGQLNVVGSREYLLYSLITPRTTVQEAFDYLTEIVASPVFKTHELVDHVYQRMENEINQLDMASQAVELLHKAAYRHGLGNSLFAPSYMVGQHKAAMLSDFHAKTHTVTRSVVAGHGIDHATLTRISSKLRMEKGHGPTQPIKYFGGEEREMSSGNLVTVAIGNQTCGADNVKESLAFMLLKNILGNGPNIKRGSLSGKLGKAVAKIEGQKAVGSFNFTYQDTGLAGALVTCEAAIAGNVISEVVAALRSVSVTDEEVQAAKKVLRMDMSETMHNPEAVVETLAAHTMSNVEANTESMADLLGTVTKSDINAAAKKLVSGNLSMSSVGNTKALPYLDAL